MNQKVEAVTIGLALHDLCIEFMASSLRIYGSTKEIFLWQLVYSTYLNYVQLFKTSLFLGITIFLSSLFFLMKTSSPKQALYKHKLNEINPEGLWWWAPFGLS